MTIPTAADKLLPAAEWLGWSRVDPIDEAEKFTA